MNKTARSWLAYGVAAALGLVTAYGVQRLAADIGGMAGGLSIAFWISTIGTPLGALAAFAIAYMPLSGRVLTGKFWALGLLVVLIPTMAVFAGLLYGYLTWLKAAVTVSTVVITLGAILMRPRGA